MKSTFKTNICNIRTTHRQPAKSNLSTDARIYQSCQPILQVAERHPRHLQASAIKHLFQSVHSPFRSLLFIYFRCDTLPCIFLLYRIGFVFWLILALIEYPAQYLSSNADQIGNELRIEGDSSVLWPTILRALHHSRFGVADNVACSHTT